MRIRWPQGNSVVLATLRSPAHRNDAVRKSCLSSAVVTAWRRWRGRYGVAGPKDPLRATGMNAIDAAWAELVGLKERVSGP